MKANNKSKNSELKDIKTEPGIIIIDMPEVKDISGQEHIVPPQFNEMQDTTISSADEEGEGILDDLNTDDQTIATYSSNVTTEEKRDLKKSGGHQPTDETKDFDDMVLDERDDDGELLNEKSIRQDRSGEDLDMPTPNEDDDNDDDDDDDKNTGPQEKKIITVAKGMS
ncbi:MAG TPA: hypothetical protein VKI61_12880 [Chitinophagaceae bacterium]|jgi:hypothetical protein|nr:hypothetical protein [Chitinophagaceae bacterium]